MVIHWNRTGVAIPINTNNVYCYSDEYPQYLYMHFFKETWNIIPECPQIHLPTISVSVHFKEDGFKVSRSPVLLFYFMQCSHSADIR